jgi:hypothetical protein
MMESWDRLGADISALSGHFEDDDWSMGITLASSVSHL